MEIKIMCKSNEYKKNKYYNRFYTLAYNNKIMWSVSTSNYDLNPNVLSGYISTH